MILLYYNDEIKNMLLLYIVAFILLSAERIMEYIMKEHNYNWLETIFKKGLINYNSSYTEKLTCKRGKGFFLINGKQCTEEERDTKKYCIFTMWSAMHLLFYIFLGYHCPSLFCATLLLGVAFEIFEYFAFDCHDMLDIVYNSCGFGIGYLLKKKSGI